MEEKDREALLQGLVAQCPEIALAPNAIEVPVYASYAMFDAQNAVRLHRLADETAADGGHSGASVVDRHDLGFSHSSKNS